MMGLYFKGCILFLMVFNSAELFHRLYQLPWYRGTLADWVANVEPEPGSSILEVGSASGVFARTLFQEGYRVTGSDLSEEMLERARAESPPELPFVQADLLNLPFKNASFSNVLGASIINVVPDPQKGVMEMARVCAEGGKVSVLFPVKGFDESRLERYIETNQLEGFSREALIMWNDSATKMDSGEVEEYFENAGLKDIQVHFYLEGMVASVTGRR